MRALVDPELYLESKNVPDVCVLAQKALDSFGNEIAFDWFDHFQESCQIWEIPSKSIRKINDKKYGTNNDRSSSSRNISNSRNDDNRVINQINNRGREEKENNNLKRERENENENENLSSEDMTQDLLDTTEHRVRFSHAVRSLEKSGIIKRKIDGAVITRQIFTWLGND